MSAARRRRADSSALHPLIDDRARAALDAVDVPISVTSAVRDRDGRLLDFRLEAVNVAAATWAGLDRAAILGRLATDLLPGLRPTGLFDELDRVVTTGQPFRQSGRYEGSVEEGRPFAATYDLMAIRHGDGYLSAWAERGDGVPSPIDLEVLLQGVQAAIPLVRPNVSAATLRLHPAT
jgi:PAS domain-containing protein